MKYLQNGISFFFTIGRILLYKKDVCFSNFAFPSIKFVHWLINCENLKNVLLIASFRQ